MTARDSITFAIGSAQLTVPKQELLEAFIAKTLGTSQQVNKQGIALAEGETYIGSITNADGTSHHIVLLPGDVEKTLEEAMCWAASIGGDLPSRVEQALLYANHAGRFEKRAYWSNQKHATEDGFAWCQYFTSGFQYYGDFQFTELRAVAVRRLSIQ
ncbi:DUF1566 domain-containing protein [Pandoraea sp. XJJ-1]|uniref:DUF1566 domain-containing protein n=1 Tax=Pandoraea sp. XJJ-1 TaxID=3002643 RepID=UPI00227DA28C|nr:DUF1566 domain-containing protein [Pandoraea sp. XJJ-1]WAL80981.1 DUF1566 domain-containing protein [Pandoraea sp. XJJ-1]